MNQDLSTAEQVYATELQPILAELEAKRTRVRNRVLLSTAIILAVGLALALPGLRYLGPFALFILLFIAITAWWAVNRGPLRRYRALFKNEVMQRLVRLAGYDLTYTPDAGISETEFRASRIYQRGIDRYNCEDLLEGTFGATRFRLSEVHAEYKETTTDSKGHTQTTWHTIFKGIFFGADFNKDFSGITLVLPDTFQGFLGGFGQTLQNWGGRLGGRPGELVTLEDVEFEKLFVVYSTDQIEARYLLSTSLMQRLVAFRQRMRQPVALSFISSYLYIAIPSGKNHFEPPSLWRGSALMTFEDLQEYLADLNLARDIVEDLNLNLRIWTKQ